MVAALVVSLTLTANSQAFWKPRNCAKLSPRQELRCAKQQLHRTKQALRTGTRHHSPGYWRWRNRVARKWVRQAHNRMSHRLAGADLPAWMCIHSYEGSWTDPNPPYWGGLQMDYGFQATYGGEFLARWGTADRWPVWAQITAARRARDGYAGYGARGYWPWANTARLCGLLA